MLVNSLIAASEFIMDSNQPFWRAFIATTMMSFFRMTNHSDFQLIFKSVFHRFLCEHGIEKLNSIFEGQTSTTKRNKKMKQTTTKAADEKGSILELE